MKWIRKVFKRLKSIKVYALVFILLGLIIFSFEGICKEFFIDGGEFWNNISEGWKRLIESIGIAFFTLGIGTLFFEVAEFTEFFVKRLTDVMINDGFLEYVNETKMEEMKQKIEKKLYFKDKIVGQDNFYYIVHHSLKKLLNSYYYSECFLHIECDIDKTNNTIIKKSHKEIKVVNINTSKNKRTDKNPRIVSIPFGGEFKRIPNKTNEEIYVISSVVCKREVKIEDEIVYIEQDHTAQAREKLKEKLAEDSIICKDEYYPIRIDFDYEIDLCESCTIEMDVITVVPLSDKYFSNKLSAPCQKYRVIFNINDENYNLDCFPFSFLKDNYGKAAVIHRSSRSVLVEFTDWLMPGEGVLISISDE